MPVVVLEPYAERHLPLLVPWFDDPGTQRWLGGPRWPRIVLDLLLDGRTGEEFRGSRVLRAFGFVALEGDLPVAYVGGDVYDRGHRVTGPDAHGEVVAEPCPGPPLTTAGIAFVVAPAERGRGVGRAALHATLTHPSLDDVQDWSAGVEPGNLASRRLLESCGFAASTRGPDAEGMLVHRRAADPGGGRDPQAPS